MKGWKELSSMSDDQLYEISKAKNRYGSATEEALRAQTILFNRENPYGNEDTNCSDFVSYDERKTPDELYY